MEGDPLVNGEHVLDGPALQIPPVKVAPAGFGIFYRVRGRLGPVQLPKRVSPSAVLGVGVMLIYAGYGSAKNFLTTLFHETGYFALAVLYFSFGLASLAAPAFTARYGTRKCIAFGGMCFASFILFIRLAVPAALLVSAAFVGVGAALLWNGQALYINWSCEPEDEANANALFYSIYSLNGIIGNLVLGVLFANEVGQKTVFLVLTVVTFLGALTVCLLPSTNHGTTPQTNIRADVGRTTDMILGDGTFQAIVPAFFVSGSNTALISGVIPPLLPDKSMIGFVFVIYAVTSLTVGLAWGRIVSQVNGSKKWVPPLTVWFVSYVVAMGLISYQQVKNASPFLYYAAYSAFGVADATLATVLMLALSVLYRGKQAGTAFAGYRTVAALAQSAGFVYAHYVNLHALQGGLAFLSLVSVVVFSLAMRKPHAVKAWLCVDVVAVAGH